MKKSFATADVVISALAILVPPLLIGGGHWVWSAVSPVWSGPRAVAAVQPAAPLPWPAAAPVAAPPATPEPAPSLAADSSGAVGPVTISARADRRAVAVGGDGIVHVELTITGEAREGGRTPTDLIVVLDRSGSMAGAPLENARAATRSIIGALQPEDRFALVTYDDLAKIEAPLGLADAEHRSSWLRIVQRIDDGGSTNMSGGMDQGLSMLREPTEGRGKRLILISDGLPNAGDSSPTGLARRAREAAGIAVPLSTVGVGMSFDETLMRDLADAGAGNYHYVADSKNLAGVFEAELNQATATVASGLTITAPKQKGVRLLSASGYPIDQIGGADQLKLGALAAGQTRTLWLTYQVDANEAGAQLDLGALSLSFEADGERLATMVPGQRAVSVLADPQAALASIDPDAWTEAVLTEDYNALRQQVADAVKSGDQAQATAAIETYRARNTAMNTSVRSAAVDQNLIELDWLRRSVTDSFSGEGQQQKQNAMSKSVGSDAYLSRRKGQVWGSDAGQGSSATR